MKSSGTHISTVSRIMSVILPGFGADKNAQHELKIIDKRIKKGYSKLFSPITGKISTLLPENLQKIKSNLDYLRPALDGSVGLEEELQLELFQRILINSLLRSKNINLGMLKFDYIKEEVSKISGKGVIEMEAVFKSRIAVFTSLKTAEVHKSYLEVYRLWMLSTYNFEDLISKFKKANFKNNKNTFVSCYGDKIVEELKDLYFLCSDFKPDKTGLKLINYISNIQKDKQFDEQAVLSHYAGIQEFLNRTAPAEILRDIIISSTRDTNIDFKQPEILINFIEKIQTSIIAKFKTSRNVYQKEISEKAYKSQIKSLFGSQKLSTLEGYSLQISKTLISNDLTGLTHITALKLLKSFSQLFYEDEIKTVYDNFLKKIGFLSLNFETDFQNSINSCRELNNSIKKFEEDLMDPKYSKLLPIIDSCTKKTIKKEQQKQINTTIDGINRLAIRIVETGTSELHSIMQAGISSIEDIKSKNPTIVDNNRYMRDSERELMNTMEESIEKLLRFMKIMKHFSINKDLFKKWKRGMSQE